MKKKLILIMLMVLITAVLAACGGNSNSSAAESGTESGEKITLRLSTYMPATHVMIEETLQPFMDKITEETNGQVEFEFYPAGQLGSPADALDLTKDGVADISYYVAAYFQSQMPISNPLPTLPGVYLTAYEGTMAYHELAKEEPILESDFLSNGVRNIFSYALPQSELFSKGIDIRVPSDLKNLQVRVSGEIANNAILKLGASPINLTTSELYEGLERGVYEAILVNSSSVTDYGISELIENGTIGANFGGTVTGMIINENVFQSLPEDVQEVIIRVGDELSESNAKFNDARNADLIQGYKDAGVNMVELSADEIAEWEAFYEEFVSNYLAEKNDPDLETALEAMREKVEAYR